MKQDRRRCLFKTAKTDDEQILLLAICECFRCREHRVVSSFPGYKQALLDGMYRGASKHIGTA